MRTRPDIARLVFALFCAAGLLGAAEESVAQKGRGEKRRDPEPAESSRDKGGADERNGREPRNDEETLERLGVDPRRHPDRLIAGVKRLIRIRQQMGVAGRGDVGRYRDAVEGYARFLKRDNLSLVRDTIRRAEGSYQRLDLAWIDAVTARLRTDSSILEVVSADPGKLTESVTIARTIAGDLEEVQRLVGEGEQREAELDRSFRNLVRLGEEARRVHQEIQGLSPPPGVLLMSESIRSMFDAEVRPIREREESLRTLRVRLSERGDRSVRRELIAEMRAAVRKIFAIQRAVQEERDGRR
jgi:hypothetical protein